MRRRTQVRVSQWTLFGVWSFILFGMAFAAGRSSTPYRPINDLPAGEYTTKCPTQQADGTVLSTVQNAQGDVTRLVGYKQPLPTAFTVVRDYKDHGRFKYQGYAIIDTTGTKPIIFWHNHRDST